MLAELAKDQHGRDRHEAITQVHGPRVEVRPLRPACLYYYACGGYSGVTKEEEGAAFGFPARVWAHLL